MPVGTEPGPRRFRWRTPVGALWGASAVRARRVAHRLPAAPREEPEQRYLVRNSPPGDSFDLAIWLSGTIRGRLRRPTCPRGSLQSRGTRASARTFTVRSLVHPPGHGGDPKVRSAAAPRGGRALPRDGPFGAGPARCGSPLAGLTRRPRVDLPSVHLTRRRETAFMPLHPIHSRLESSIRGESPGARLPGRASRCREAGLRRDLHTASERPSGAPFREAGSGPTCSSWDRTGKEPRDEPPARRIQFRCQVPSAKLAFPPAAGRTNRPDGRAAALARMTGGEPASPRFAVANRLGAPAEVDRLQPAFRPSDGRFATIVAIGSGCGPEPVSPGASISLRGVDARRRHELCPDHAGGVSAAH